MHTIDCYHVFEKLWEAGAAFLTEGSSALKAWVEDQKDKLFRDDAAGVLSDLNKRVSKLAYGDLRRRDLVISTGIVEGAVKYIVGRRCDQGGMRWIKERAQAVVQLRCIAANGDWDAFECFVHDRLRLKSLVGFSPQRLQTSISQPLPNAA